MFGSMIVALVLLGFWPQPLITTARATVDGLQQLTAGTALAQPRTRPRRGSAGRAVCERGSAGQTGGGAADILADDGGGQ